MNRISCGHPTSNMGVACVAAVTRAQRPDLFSLGRTRICCWPFRPIQCNADAWQSDAEPLCSVRRLLIEELC